MKLYREEGINPLGGEHHRDVLGGPLGAIVDLVSATRAVGDDDGIRARRAYRRQQRGFCHAQRHVEVLALVAERTRHAAAARRNRFDVELWY